MRVRFETIGGVETRYYEAGSGPPLLLIHGGGVSADSWLRNIPELARHYRVIAVDTLGHGFTDAGRLDGGAPQPHMVNHLVALANTLDLQGVTLCGSSYGAMLAMLTYFAMPERVRNLVLISSASATLSEDELANSLAAAYRNGSSAIADPTWDTCVARLARINYSSDSIPPEIVCMQLNIYSRPNAVRNYDLVMKGLMQMDACRPYRVAHRFGELRVPTLLIWGRDDQRVILQRAIDAVAQIEDGYLVRFAECKHEPHMEHPELFNEIVHDFIQARDRERFRVGAGGEVATVYARTAGAA